MATDSIEEEAQVCPACGGDVLECDCTPEAQTEAARRAEAGQDALVDASNPAQTARMAKNVRRMEQEQRDDHAWLMRHPQGRRIMWRLLERCSIFENSYVRGKGRSEAICFHLGESNIGLVYFREAMVQTPEEYNLMVKENSGRLAA